MKAWPFALGVGMAAGAVATMMMPKNCSVRRAVTQAADRVEDAAEQAAEKVLDQITG